MKEAIAKTNKTKSWFFEKVNKIYKLLTWLIKKNGEKTQINKIRNENVEITTEHRNTKDHKKLLWTTICKQNGQPGRNEQILREVQPLTTEPGRVENMNRPITSIEIETGIKIFNK